MLAAALGVSLATPASAASDVAKGAVAEAPTACVEMAVSIVDGPWVCSAGQLSYERGGAWVTEHVDGVPTTVQRAADGPIAQADDYDYWCESTGACTRYISKYIAERKINSWYGYGNETWGTFDQIWRQNFNGPYNRYRLLLIWDSGSAVDSDYWRAAVREEVSGLPDPTKGVAYFYPATVSSASWRAYSPSSTGLTQVDEAISNTSRTHHDDLYGYFFARGSRFGTTIEHLPDFKCPSKRCYYPGA